MKTSTGWEEKKLSELFRIETGTTPSTRSSEYWDNATVNWITPTDLSHNVGNVYISGSERKVTPKAVDENNLTLLPKKSLILSTRAPVGYVAVLENEAVFNQGCKGLVPKVQLCPEFYYYCLLSKQKMLENRSSGSTFKELGKDLLEKVLLPFPSLAEQQRISQALSVLDARLENIERQKEKLQRIKISLMADLLSEKKKLCI